MQRNENIGINVIYCNVNNQSNILVNEIFKHFSYDLDEKFSINLGYTVKLYGDLNNIPDKLPKKDINIFLVSANFFQKPQEIISLFNNCHSSSTLIVGLCNGANKLFDSYNMIRLDFNHIEKDKFRLMCVIAQKIIKKNVTVFLSYYRQEGEKICSKIDNIISSIPDFNSFVDTKNISYSENVQDKIDKELEKSLFMCISTNKYSERIWCAHELIYAKYKDVPIIIIDCLSDSEIRRSPNAGNVPVYRLDKITESTVSEALFGLLKEKLRKDSAFYETGAAGYAYLWKAPELSRILQIKTEDRSVTNIVYPAPPLPVCEINYYKELIQDCNFLLNNNLHLLENSNKNNKVCISVSDSQDNKNLHPNFLNSIISEIIRYLIYGNYKILYGGDWRTNGYTQLMLDYIIAYQKHHTGHNTKLYNYFLNLKAEDEVELQSKIFNYGKIIIIDPVYTSENMIDRASSLTKMRKKLIHDSDALIAIAGDKNTKRVPGVIEEICKAIHVKKPVYLIGSAGGATRWFIESIKKHDKKLNLPHTIRSDNAVDEINDVLSKFSIDDLSELNKLSKKENELLFYSCNIQTIIKILFNGLMRIQ